MAIDIKKGMLLRSHYEWEATGGDDPNARAIDARFLNRREGYEVISMMQLVADHLEYSTAEEAAQIEAAIADELPGNIRGRKKVFEWLVHFLTNESGSEDTSDDEGTSGGEDVIDKLDDNDQHEQEDEGGKKEMDKTAGKEDSEGVDYNQELRDIQAHKAYRIHSHNSSEEKAANIPAVPDGSPNFTLSWGDFNDMTATYGAGASGEARDNIESEDYEVMILEANNPYENLIIKELIVTRVELSYVHNGDEVGLPKAPYTDEPLADLSPSRLIRFGDLEPGESAFHEIVLATFRTPPGPYKIRIHSDYWIAVIADRNTQQSMDHFDIEIVRS